MNFEDLLTQNYGALKDPRCKTEVIDYLRNNPSIENKSIDFIQIFTKVAHLILESDPNALEGLLERLFRYNEEGARKIKSDPRKNEFLRLEFYLLAYAGETANVIFEKTKELGWAEKWYESSKASADLSTESEPIHSAYAYGFAGDAAKALLKKTGDLEWGKKWYEDCKKSAEMSIEFEPKHSFYSYSFAADAARALFYTTEDTSWAKEWYALDKKSADMSVESDPTHAVNSYIFAGNAAKALLRAAPSEKTWAKKAIRCFRAALGCYESHPDMEINIKLIEHARKGVNYLQRRRKERWDK